MAARRKSSTKDVVPCLARSDGQLKPHTHTYVEMTIISQGLELIEVDGLEHSPPEQPDHRPLTPLNIREERDIRTDGPACISSHDSIDSLPHE